MHPLLKAALILNSDCFSNDVFLVKKNDNVSFIKKLLFLLKITFFWLF